MIVIKPEGGLCNYLRVIFSYFNIAKQLNKKLVVIWIKTEACPGYFLDYFEPIHNIAFIYNNNHNFKINYIGFSVHNDFPPSYNELKLRPNIMSIINNKINILGNYIAVHIRRTDHIQSAIINNCYSNDEQFINYININIKDNNLYIATDNINTYNLFKNKYNDKLKFNYHNSSNRLRQTSLQDAIIDLYMCVYAKDFMGSGWSSFSDLINFSKLTLFYLK
jgi:hypothetical protein